MTCINWRLYKTMIILLLLTLVGSGCVREWDHDVTKRGIHFKKLGQDQKTGNYVGVLAEDTEIEGFPCKQGWAHFDPNMGLRSFASSKPIDNGVSTIPTGTWIRLGSGAYPRTCAFPGDTKIQDFLCRGTGGPKGVQVGFYPSGRLRCFFAPDSVEIDGVPCKGSVFHIIRLHENARLQECVLSQDTVIDGKSYRRGRKLRFNAQGEVLP